MGRRSQGILKEGEGGGGLARQLIAWEWVFWYLERGRPPSVEVELVHSLGLLKGGMSTRRGDGWGEGGD